jgi:tRNA-splicing ligase RtcB
MKNPQILDAGPTNATIKFWTSIEGVEEQALQQLKNISSLPWVFSHVAVMPDVHFGKGATVGSVIAMKGACSPAAVGVDVGCGMLALRTSLRASDLPDSLDILRQNLERAVPVGFSSHTTTPWTKYENPAVSELFERFFLLDPDVHGLMGRAAHQIGTLGGGNHFIELCLESRCNRCENGSGHTRHVGRYNEEIVDDCTSCRGGKPNDPQVWLMLHSGSRNIGKELAEIHISKARELAHNEDLPDPDLAVFLAGTPEMKAYQRDLGWAQEYARQNRLLMMDLCKDVLERYFRDRKISYDKPIVCHHNYLSQETHFGEQLYVTRKGAISARKDELGIIPGSMGTKSYIVRGLGNADSFHSASHGAGRRLSRGAAKRKFSLEDMAEQTSGVCCRKDLDVIDEIPGAYKPIEEVMSNQDSLVEIVTELKQVLCVKG